MCLFLLRQLFLIQHLVLMLVAKIYFLCYLTASKLHIQKRFQLHFSVKILYKSNQNYLQISLLQMKCILFVGEIMPVPTTLKCAKQFK